MNKEDKFKKELTEEDIQIEVDKQTLIANGYDAAHLIVQLIDAKGNPVKNQDRKLEFEIDGPITSLGVDNGWVRNTQPYHNNEIVTHTGRALSIFQSTTEKGKATFTVIGAGLKSSGTTIYLK